MNLLSVQIDITTGEKRTFGSCDFLDMLTQNDPDFQFEILLQLNVVDKLIAHKLVGIQSKI